MSSTNRGGKREVSDYYQTPLPAIQAFLTAWCADEYPRGFPFRFVLNPCAGGFRGTRTVKPEVMAYPTAIQSLSYIFPDLKAITTVDIREDSPALQRGLDYRLLSFDREHDLVISNPPFCFAQEFIEKALRDVKRGGHVVMLLRLNYLESIGRLNFWTRHMPERIYVHAQRMSFTPDGKTDSVAYMHAVWREGSHPDAARLRVI